MQTIAQQTKMVKLRRWRRARAHANASAMGKALVTLASFGNAKIVGEVLQQMINKHHKRFRSIKRPSKKWIAEEIERLAAARLALERQRAE